MFQTWFHVLTDWMRDIQSAGLVGDLLFVLLYALFCLLFIPGSVLTVMGGAVYGFWIGSLLVLAGNGLGSVLSLLLTRFFFRNWIARQTEKHPKLAAVSKAVAEDDWKLVFLTRLSPIMPFSLINYSLGLTNVSTWRFLLATELGAIPATLVYVYLGTLVGNLAHIKSDLMHHHALEWTLQGFGLIVVIGVTFYVTRLVNRAVKKRLDSTPPTPAKN